MPRTTFAIVAGIALAARGAAAQPSAEPTDEAPAAEPEPAVIGGATPFDVQIHGFVSQGGFVSTSNDYIGRSSRGSAELFQAGLNASADVTGRLHVGLQLFSHDEGVYGDYTPRVDWAYLDYRWRRWLGVRAGHIKIPFGLYNEYVDIDAARLPILLPQSVYPIGNRDVLLAHTGAALYGVVSLGSAGELDYQVYGGTLDVPLGGPSSRASPQVYGVDTHYLLGAQLFYLPPLEGLRVGASVLRTDVDFYLDLDAATTAGLIAAGVVPADFNGQVTTSISPATLMVGSAEYERDEWRFAAEYARWLFTLETSLPSFPPSESQSERFFVMASRRLSDRAEVGAYYSVFYPDVDDRGGDDPTLAKPYYAWQRDAAASARYDLNDHWLLKAEAHFIDGVASLFDGGVGDTSLNPDPDRYWGLFLVNTTVIF